MATRSPRLGALQGFVNSLVRFGGRPALHIDGTVHSYNALGEYAARIASTIATHSSEDIPFVALLAHRSLTAYAGVLGILGAGKAYVPLNPKLPVDRLLRIHAVARPPVIVVGQETRKILELLLPKLPAGTILICPDMDGIEELRRSYVSLLFIGGHDMVFGVGLERMSRTGGNPITYLLFTSGSTGDPKGVPVRQNNVLAYVRYVANRYEVNENDRFSQMFDMSFDLSVHDMFVCWESGACLHVVPESAVMAPAKFIRDHKITMWFSVPSVIGVMEKLGLLNPGSFPTLRASLFCGEPLLHRHAQAWQEAAPNSFVENLYGPTEATIAITHYRWNPAGSQYFSANDFVPLGHAFAGQHTCIVDSMLNRVPSGESGELCLSGSQVTEGYINSTEQTRKSFMTLSGTRNVVWYRTGDLVREDRDGCLHYIGRMDHQVKISGHRIELSEVECALREASGSQQVAALAWPVYEGLAEGVVAFIAGSSDRDVGPIIQRCRQVLPGYMVPSAVYFIGQLPLSVHGKIDRHKLQELLKEPPRCTLPRNSYLSAT